MSSAGEKLSTVGASTRGTTTLPTPVYGSLYSLAHSPPPPTLASPSADRRELTRHSDLPLRPCTSSTSIFRHTHVTLLSHTSLARFPCVSHIYIHVYPTYNIQSRKLTRSRRFYSCRRSSPAASPRSTLESLATATARQRSICRS